MKRLALTLLSASVLAVSAVVALQAEETAPAAAPTKPEAVKEVKDYLVATVNGEKIFYRDLEKIWDDLFPGDGKAPPLAGFGDAIRDNIVRGMVSEKLMLKEAERQNLGESTAVKEKLAQLRSQLMVQELLKKRNESLNEENVKKRYNEMVQKASGKEEVHARHILVEKKEDADKLYKQIKDGADFAKLATEKSSDRGSAARGGDLGYFQKDQMVPEFADAAYKLKKGELSAPVKSAFGWHIIKVEDRRKVPVPTLQESRPQIEHQLQAEANQQYITDLLKDADVKHYNPEGEEIPFPAEQKAEKPKQ